MKKITTLFSALLLTTFGWQANAQVLNQNAAWPNAAWTLSGTYSVADLLNDPTTSANFSYDDDGAGNGSTDILEAESPIINLTAAAAAGETWLNIDYEYNNNVSYTFNFEYYDVDAAGWVVWDAITDNSTLLNGWCAAVTSPGVTSATLDVTSFTATQLSGFRYRINYDASAGWGWGFCMNAPTIVSTSPPTCIDPTILTASTVLATSANLGWTSSASAWDIEWGAAGFTPTGTPTITGTTTNPHSITTLTSATSYQFYVRADCAANGTSAWVGPFTFTTTFNAPSGVTCITGNAVKIFSDDMETAIGWTGDISTASGDWDFPTASPGGNSSSTGPSGPASGTTFAEYEASGPNNLASMITPMIDLSTGTSQAELSFFMHAYGSEIGTLNVGVGTSPSGPFTTEFSWTGQFQSSATQAWANIGVDLTAYLGQQIYIEFSYAAIGTSFYGDLAIDLVEVETCISCPSPSTLTATNITAFTADLFWSELYTATLWDIELDTAGFTPTGTPTAGGLVDTTYLPTGLLANTTYSYYVRANCGGGDLSAWTGPFNFTTLCATYQAPYYESFEANGLDCWTITNTSTGFSSYNWLQNSGFTPTSWSTGPNGANTGTEYMYTESSSGSTGDTTLFESPNIELTGVTNTQLSFAYHMYGANIDTLYIQVNDGTGFITVDTINGPQQTGNTDAWLIKKVDLSAYDGAASIQVGFLAVRGAGGAGDISIDDIRVTEACVMPTAGTASNLSSSSASLSWITSGTAATSWSIEYGPTGFVQGTGSVINTTFNPHPLVGLPDGTTYDFYIISNCALGDKSPWAGPYNFTTFVTGVDENIANNGVSIFPNPNNGIFSLEVNASNATVKVMNTQGQIILTKNILKNKAKIDLSNNAKGIYFVTVTSENGVSTHKVSVQ